MVEHRSDRGDLFSRLFWRAQTAARGKHGSQIVRQAFIDPQQFAAHGLLEIRSGQANRAAKLAIPGMSELVGEEIGCEKTTVGIGEGVLRDAVVAAFMVLLAQGKNVV